MPGYVNYWFKEGKLPAHTKEEFKKYNILTVHGTIVMNALVFMFKCRLFPSSLPVSICNLIPKTIPNFDDNINDCGPWVDNFNTLIFRPSFFYKGPLLAITKENADAISASTILSIDLYKTYVKKMLIEQQSLGSDSEWPEFPLNKIPGLRKSARINSKHYGNKDK